ncbi:hypothetical protein [Colwellia sp. UCD-KL20]|uniref:hypothetical protein n=1 Tax=Colwellia sp. UCD-KL20 TaxID=1917165 RepID=UPI0009710367|nr:hypothetical protein [Colwellia sp. UCD-KL20]
MTIPTESYEDIFKNYSDALLWMEKIGVKFSSGRTQHYKKLISHWKDHYKVATKKEGNIIFPDFVSSIFEIHNFIDIYKAFQNTPNNQLVHIVEKLQKGINGPINSAEESPKSTAARNFLFEASFAARAHRPANNVLAILDAVSDTGIKIDNKKLWVECKRITTVGKIEDNVKKACKQLESTLKNKSGSGHRGIVAIEVTKLFHSGDQILVSENDTQLKNSIDKMMDNFIYKYSEIWQKLFDLSNNKIIGLVIQFAFMATSESRSLLVHTSQ